MSCNNGDFTSFAAIRGLGIAREPEFIVAEALQKGSLVEILKEYNSLASGGIYAVYPERRHLPTKVRIFIDFLVEKFRGGLCNFHKTMYPVD
jgi:DNA-binding transcriptional LysR family regulator